MGGVRALFTAMFGGVTAVLFFMAVTRGGIGGGILIAMTPLPLFMVGLSQGVTFAALAGMIATGIAARIGGKSVAGELLLWMVLPVLVLVPVALASGLPLRWPWQSRAKTDDALAAELAAAPTVPLKPRGLGPNGIKPKRFFERPGWLNQANAAAVDLPGRGGVIAGRLVLALVILGFVAFAGFVYNAQSEPGGVKGLEDRAMRETLSQMQGLMSTDVSAAMNKPSVKMLWAAMPGIGIASWLLLIAVNGILAQGALGSFEWNMRPAPVLSGLILPRWFALVFALALAAAVLGRDMVAATGMNLAIIAGVGLLFDGLALVHCLAARSPAPRMFLVMAYVVISSGWPVLLVAILGLSDLLLDLRRRLAAGVRRGE